MKVVNELRQYFGGVTFEAFASGMDAEALVGIGMVGEVDTPLMDTEPFGTEMGTAVGLHSMGTFGLDMVAAGNTLGIGTVVYVSAADFVLAFEKGMLQFSRPLPPESCFPGSGPRLKNHMQLSCS